MVTIPIVNPKGFLVGSIAFFSIELYQVNGRYWIVWSSSYVLNCRNLVLVSLGQ